MTASTGTDRDRERRRPPSTEVPVVSWLASRRAWLLTLGLYAVIAALVAAFGALRYGEPFVETLARTVTQPLPALATFLGARGLALLVVQRERDAAVAAGDISVTDDTSQGALVTVASFSIIGLVATAIAFPILYTTAQFEYQLLAAAVAVLVVPVSYALLVYQLGELLSADRYRRRYAVQPALWHYAWTLPLALLAWTLLSGQSLPVPTNLSPSGNALRLDAWGLAYVATCAPTAVALTYVARRQVERYGRALAP
jgi:uncharacterized membrane-anchored protein